MKTTAVVSVPVLVVALVVSACTSDIKTVTAPAGNSGISKSASASPSSRGRAGHVRTIDDAFVDLSRTMPGFGGLYLEEDGSLVVLMQPGKTLDRTRMANFLTEEGVLHPSARSSAMQGLKVREADYSFDQLRAAANALGASIWSAGANMLDVDEKANRVVVGADAASIGAVRQSVQALDPALIPFVQVIESERIARTQGLQGTVRPVITGVKTTIGAKTCTMGFQVTFSDFTLPPDSGRYVTTAAHCTYEMGAVTPSAMGQPGSSPAIADEAYEPDVYYYPEYNCPMQYMCSYADVSFFRLHDSVPWTFSKIAKVNYYNPSPILTPPWQLGYDILNGQAVVGTFVGKVGQTTGLTTGLVNRTCTDYPVSPPNPTPPGTYGVKMLCQWQVAAKAHSGDSGAAVWETTAGPGSGLKAAVGMLWGADTVYHKVYTFTPIHLARAFLIYVYPGGSSNFTINYY